MCVSLAPARFSSTILYAAETVLNVRGRNTDVHVLGYQNTVQNLSRHIGSSGDRSLLAETGGNAMILPIAADPGTRMTSENVVDTKNMPTILEDMARAVTPIRRTLGAKSVSSDRGGSGVQVFESGIYTVVLAFDARDIPGALSRVPREKRPKMNDRIFEAYSRWYPGWRIALCCFSNTQAAKATPMLWWYEPRNPNELFLPTLDCHTGDVPDLNERVGMDHTLIVSSFRMESEGSKVAMVNYNDPVPFEYRNLVARYVIGAPVRLLLQNGDFTCDLHDVRQGIFSPRRVQPPGA